MVTSSRTTIISAIFFFLFFIPAWGEPLFLESINISLLTDDSIVAELGFKDGHPTTKSFTLTDHDRIVIDCLNTINSLRKKRRYYESSKLLKSLRTSQFTPKPSPVTRLVFDLSVPCNYIIEPKNKSIRISIFAKGSEPPGTTKAAGKRSDQKKSKITSKAVEEIKKIKEKKSNFESDFTTKGISISADSVTLLDLLNGFAILNGYDLILHGCRPDTMNVRGIFSGNEIKDLMESLLENRNLLWSISGDSALVIESPEWSE